MKTELRIAVRALGAVILAAPACSLWGTGFRLPDQDAFATARGEAFVATADNASAIYYNPAGLTQLYGHSLRAGVYGLYTDVHYTSPSGQTFANQKDLHAVPQGFYAWKIESLPLAVGLGAYSGYGLSSEWPQDTGFRTIATEGSILSYTINPTVAWEIVPSLSLGAGLRVNYGEMDLQQGLVYPATPNDLFRFKGDGWAVSYDLGVLWKAHEKVSLGAAFKSTTSFDLQGHTEYYIDPYGGNPWVDAQTSVKLPLNVVCGLSYRPTTNWNFEFNADYTDWSSLGTLNIQQAYSYPPFRIPKDVPLALNWHGSWYYEFGATYYMQKNWSVSAGYIYNENSVSDATYNPLVADLNRHFLSVGTGHKGKHFNFDIAYQFGYGPARTVTGSAYSAGGQTADGVYKYLSHSVFLTAGWQF